MEVSEENHGLLWIPLKKILMSGPPNGPPRSTLYIYISASSIARSCLLCSVTSIKPFGSIWYPVILLLWITWWCFLIAACCLNLSLIVVRVCPIYVDWEVVNSSWLHVYWYTTLNIHACNQGECRVAESDQKNPTPTPCILKTTTPTPGTFWGPTPDSDYQKYSVINSKVCTHRFFFIYPL